MLDWAASEGFSEVMREILHVEWDSAEEFRHRHLARALAPFLNRGG